MKVIVETSARHVHLTGAHVAALFGEGYKLSVKRELSQPGEFAAEEKVDVAGPKGVIKGITVMGPASRATQIEVSLTDARTLGIDAPIRESGHASGSPGCTITGPKGSIEIKEGVIAAKRHVHMTPASAAECGVKDQQLVQVRLEGERALTFDEVVVRVNANFAPAMHIDTDEANACAAKGTVYGEIIALPRS